MAEWVYVLIGCVGVIFIAFVGKRAGWFQLVSGTNKLLREQNQELRNQNEFLKGQLETTTAAHEQDKKDWAARHNESLIEIAKLQGKIDNLTAIPLAKIDRSLELLAVSSKENADTNKAILQQLQSTAKINAEDRNVLTNQNMHIRTEVNKIIDKDVKPNKK